MTLDKLYLSSGQFCFHPMGKDDARLIQEKLLAMGFRWAHTGRTDVAHLQTLESGTLVLKDGGMSCLRERTVVGRLLDKSDFENDTRKQGAAPPEPYAYLTEMFNRVFDRLDAIETRLTALEKRVPEEDRDALDKPALRKPSRHP